MLETFSNYCIWTSIEGCHEIASPFDKQFGWNIYQFKDSFDTIASEWGSKIRQRKRRNPALDAEKYIPRIQQWISNEPFKCIVGRKKPQPSSLNFENNRSSTYIGVSKNGDNWQVLINNGKFKKYVGTFVDEKQAAITYDFYAICLKLSKAKTNFTYSTGLISEMIQCYNYSTKTFDASNFIHRL